MSSKSPQVIAAWIGAGSAVVVALLTGYFAVLANQRPDPPPLSDPHASDPAATARSEPGQEADEEPPELTKVPTPEPEPLLRVWGRVFLEYGATLPPDLRAAVVWATDGPGRDTVFQDMSCPVGADLRYELRFDEVPPDGILSSLPEGKLGVGAIVLFNDGNGNGLMDGDEKLLGGSSTHMVTYLRGKVPADKGGGKRFWTLQRLPQGYSHVEGVSPEVHRMPTVFDDLIPIEPRALGLTLMKDPKTFRTPNWT